MLRRSTPTTTDRAIRCAVSEPPVGFGTQLREPYFTEERARDGSWHTHQVGRPGSRRGQAAGGRSDATENDGEHLAQSPLLRGDVYPLRTRDHPSP